MKLAWVLLVSLLLVYLLDPAECWRRRRFRVRVRVRRVIPRIRVRRVIPRIRVRRVVPRIRRVIQRVSLRRVLPVLTNTMLRVRLRNLLRRRGSIRISLQNTPSPTTPGIQNVTPIRNDSINNCPEICAGNCPYSSQCSTWNCPCQWVCATTCDWFSEEEFNWPYDGYAPPLPCDFVTYDADANGVLSLEELSYQLRMRSRHENNIWFFNKLDLDQNGSITNTEFDSILLLKDCGSDEDGDTNTQSTRASSTTPAPTTTRAPTQGTYAPILSKK